MLNFCPECGVKLDKEFKFCPNCGFNLISAPQTASYSKSKKTKLPYKTNTKEAVLHPTEKGLSNKNIFLIVASIMGAAFVILLLSGVFDSPLPQQQITQQQPPVNTNSGVNLNNIQQIKDMEERIKIEPDNMELVLQLGHLNMDSGLNEAAIKNYKTYLEKNPKDADTRVDMGVCYFNLKNYPVALTEIKAALKYKPDHQIAHLNLGVINLAAGNVAESKEWLEKAVTLDPNSEVGKRAAELLRSH